MEAKEESLENYRNQVQAYFQAMSSKADKQKMKIFRILILFYCQLPHVDSTILIINFWPIYFFRKGRIHEWKPNPLVDKH